MILTIHRHVIARIPRFGITHDSQKTWLLHVKGAQPEDRGYYMCQVNTNPMISQVGYLQVVGKYIFSCVAFSSPKPFYPIACYNYVRITYNSYTAKFFYVFFTNYLFFDSQKDKPWTFL